MDYLLDEFYDEAAQPIVDIAQKMSSEAVGIICDRINTIGEMSASDINRITALTRMADIRKIQEAIAHETGLAEKEVEETLGRIAKKNQELSEVYYKASGVTQVPYTEHLAMRNIIRAASKNLKGDVLNLSRTAGFQINGEFTDIAKAYNKVIDKAIFEVQQGTTDFHTAMRSTVRDLSKSGLRVPVRDDKNKIVQWQRPGASEPHYTRRVDSSVRMNILDGCRQMSMEITELEAEEFGADGYELSAHALCRPEHQEAQGQIFTKEEFEELNNTLDTPIATGEYNCQHLKFPVIVAIAKKSSDKGYLKSLINESNKTTVFQGVSGKEMVKTKYDASQYQRQMETKVRSYKEQAAALERAGDKGGAEQVRKEAREMSRQYYDISRQMGIDPEPLRLRV
jgi:hypothetical protein